MTHVEYSRTFTGPIDTVYEAVVRVPLSEVLGTRHLAIPGIASVDEDGVWAREIGQQRTLHFSDGGRTTEVVNVLAPPRTFGYELTEVEGPMRLLFEGIDGLWAFETAGAGTRVTWSWEIRPRLAGRVIMPAFTRMWRGMAAKAYDRLDERIAVAVSGRTP